MNEMHDEELLRRLERLAELKPTGEATQHAVDRVRQALVESPEAARRPGSVTRFTRWVAAAVLLLTAGGLLVWLLRMPAPVHAAFGDVQAALKAAHSVTCRQTTRIKNEPTDTVHTFIRDDGLFRVNEADGSYSITDTSKGRVLLVNPQKREARLLSGVNVPNMNLYELLRKLPSDASARPLPGKKIDGKDALGFAVKVMGQEFTVWADPDSKLLVRMEIEDKDKTGTVVIDDFVFDKELEAKLFSFEPPAGYKLQTQGVSELPAAPSDPQLKNLVVTPLVGIGPVKFGMMRDEVEKLLGKPDAVEPVGKSGLVNLNYGSRGVFLGVSKILGVITISCAAQQATFLRIRDFAGKTDKGIALGASAADIQRAYSEPSRKETKAGSTYLSYNKLEADFTLFGDKLVQMQFRRPRPAR
ncbi:MAG TPA: hypothetical protein VGY58_03160 [Gemmataceae bacterium]|nr:hypothetical protein [Gemmataceae bacterium]